MPLQLAKSSFKALHIKAIIFDMDGLLLDTELLSFDSFVLIAARHNIEVGMVHYEKMIGLNAASGIEILRSILPAKMDVVAFKNEWLNLYSTMLLDKVPLKDGAYSFLEMLARLNIPCAVATSSSGAKARSVLKKAGLLTFIQHVIGGDEVTAGKPAPDIYLDAAEKLCTAAIDCLAFEDSNNGTTAALAAGMKVIQIPDLAPPNRPACPPVFHICGSLAEGASLIGLSLMNTETSLTRKS